DRRLLELEAHPGEDPWRLRELDVPVVDDLPTVTPGVAEVVVSDHLGAGGARCGQRRRAIVDHDADVAALVPRLAAPGRKGDELVAHVDERHPFAPAPELDVEDPP